jgi:hypothetical protein
MAQLAGPDIHALPPGVEVKGRDVRDQNGEGRHVPCCVEHGGAPGKQGEWPPRADSSPR